MLGMLPVPIQLRFVRNLLVGTFRFCCVAVSPVPVAFCTSFVAVYKQFRFHNFFRVSLNISNHILPFISEMTEEKTSQNFIVPVVTA